MYLGARDSMQRREDGEREAMSTGRSERMEISPGVMTDRRNFKRLKGKVTSTCVTQACLYGTETLSMTELQQQRLQVCKKQVGTKNSQIIEGRQEKNVW